MCGCPLEVLEVGFDGFFRDEACGMGGENKKCYLRGRLVDFHILEN